MPHVVKWAEKEERLPWRKNFGRDGDSGTGARRIPQNGQFGVFENRGATSVACTANTGLGWGTGAVQFCAKGSPNPARFGVG